MGIDATKVLIGAPDQAAGPTGTGAIVTAELGADGPETARATFGADFTGAGYVSSDGVTVTPEYSTTDITDWSGALIRRILETFNGTIAWSYIQFDADSARQAFGEGNVTVTAATSTAGEQIRVSIGAHLPPAKYWGFKMKDGNNLIKILVPNGQAIPNGDFTFVANSPIPIPISLACYDDGTGNSIYILTDDGVFSA